ncbi:MAG: glycosyltransferase [Elusimicrobia bacterium]|nr:glycosyltransferase [Elusimicrobiota bacterium]
MKVLHVSDADAWTGGCGQMLALAAGLAGKGWESLVCCRPGSSLAKAGEEAGLKVFRTGLRQDYDVVSAWQLAGFISREGVDVLHAHHSRSHGVCLLAQFFLQARGLVRPVLVVSRRVSFKPSSNPFSLFKYQSGFNDAFAAVAAAVRDVLIANGVPAERVAVIHSGVDAERFSPKPPDPEVRRSLAIPEGTPAVGKVANYSAWKGQTCFLEAASLLVREGRKAHFILVGRDTDGPEMKAEVSRLGLEGRVTLAGFRKDMPEVLACLDVSVNAAVGGEGLSGTVRESMAMGVPAVASDVAGNREIFGQDAERFLFPPGDAAALAERLGWALDHGPEARSMARALGERVRSEFSVQATLEKTEKLYLSLVEGCVRPKAEPVRSSLLTALKALVLATFQAGLLLGLVLAGVGVAGPETPEKLGLAAAAACVLVPQLLGLGAARWLALPFWPFLAAVLAAPLAAFIAALSAEPKLFMEVVTSDGGMSPILFPDPSWKWTALFWLAGAAVGGASGWVLGLVWRRWPAGPMTRPRH